MIARQLRRYVVLASGALLPVAFLACHKAEPPEESVQPGVTRTRAVHPAATTPVGRADAGESTASTAGATPGIEALPGTWSTPSANEEPPADPTPGASAMAIVPATASAAASTGSAPSPPQAGESATAELTTDPLPPPALRTRPAMPALPSLPPPNRYPRQVALPRTSDIEECGAVWSGTEYVPMECIDPNARFGTARAAKVVIPYGRMRQAAETLPAIVDHRADGTEGPVRKQGGVPVCTAMAFTAALDHAYARWTGHPGEFSVMQVWARYHQREEHSAAGNNVGAFLASEADWPYDQKEASSYVACPARNPSYDKPCGQTPDRNKIQSMDSRAVAQITQVEAIAPGQLDVVREKLAAGQDVVVAIRMPTYATAGEPGSKYMVGLASDPNAKLKGAHQVVLAGYAMTPNGNYYLVHNSFGPKWGDRGYAWLHEDYLRAYSSDNLMVVPDVEPVEVKMLRARAHGRLTSTCATGHAPDSISGVCAGVCPDGSPRHDNVCADEGSRVCPSGMVNLTGECLMAAPRSGGTDSGSGVKWSCGPGGCTYAFLRDRLGCEETECAVSCPAPSFRLATMASGLVCVE